MRKVGLALALCIIVLLGGLFFSEWFVGNALRQGLNQTLPNTSESFWDTVSRLKPTLALSLNFSSRRTSA
jgi:hypothetical protein